MPPGHVPRVRDDGTGTITTTDGESLTGLFFGPSFFATHILAFERNVVSSRRFGSLIGAVTFQGKIGLIGVPADPESARGRRRGSITWVAPRR